MSYWPNKNDMIWGNVHWAGQIRFVLSTGGGFGGIRKSRSAALSLKQQKLNLTTYIIQYDKNQLINSNNNNSNTYNKNIALVSVTIEQHLPNYSFFTVRLLGQTRLIQQT